MDAAVWPAADAIFAEVMPERPWRAIADDAARIRSSFEPLGRSDSGLAAIGVLLTQPVFSILNAHSVACNRLFRLSIFSMSLNGLGSCAGDSMRRIVAIIAVWLLAAAAQAADMRIDEAWITMPDGIRLSADLYRRAGDKAHRKQPVLLEYLPYRKHEARSRNWPLYSYFVERGYVVAAVDIRGTGNSEGRLIPHEYSDIEHRDGEAVIAWLAQQPWSNGSVGMFGISWGGFTWMRVAGGE